MTRQQCVDVVGAAYQTSATAAVAGFTLTEFFSCFDTADQITAWSCLLSCMDTEDVASIEGRYWMHHHLIRNAPGSVQEALLSLRESV